MKKTIVILVLSMLSCGQNNGNDKDFDPAYAHVVYFWFKNPNNQEDKVRFENSLTRFLNNSKYAKTKFVGIPPKASRDIVDDSFTYSLILTFESSEAQSKYQTEEPHLKFIEECSNLWQKVVVYDSYAID